MLPTELPNELHGHETQGVFQRERMGKSECEGIFFCLIQLTFDHHVLTEKLSTTLWAVYDFRQRLDDYKAWTSPSCI